MDSIWWWGLLCAFSLFLELSSPGYFFFLSFSLGSFAAISAQLLGATLEVQVVLFCVSVGISLLCLKLYTSRLARKPILQTNVYALRGKRGVVVAPLSSLIKGWIKVEGELWAAFSSSEDTLPEGTIVEVVTSAGTHLSVKEYKEAAHHKHQK